MQILPHGLRFRLRSLAKHFGFIAWSRVASLCLAGAASFTPSFLLTIRAAENTRPAYEKDVEFLLTGLERQAGHFFQLKGIDWPTVAGQFREEVKSVKSDAEHLKLCLRLLARLKDGHAGVGDLKMSIPEELQRRNFCGPGVRLMTIGTKVYIREAFGPAAQRGFEIGIEATKIDGLPAYDWLCQRVDKMREMEGYSTDHQAFYAACHWGMGEAEGTPIEFELAHVGGANSNVRIKRQGDRVLAPFGPVFLPAHLKRIGRQRYGRTESGFGYIHLRDVPGNLPEQLDTMCGTIGDVPGLILDMRANGGGGCDHEAVFARFLARRQPWRQYRGTDQQGFVRPVVVIVDAGTRSAGETVAGMLKEDGRAFLVGDSPTAGMSSQKAILKVPSGLFSVSFSVLSNKKRFNEGRGIEGIGVPPHELVPYDLAELAQGVDSQIRRAEQLLKQGLPKERVPYEAARNQ
jgi:carboxyl-terminal processing protease